MKQLLWLLLGLFVAACSNSEPDSPQWRNGSFHNLSNDEILNQNILDYLWARFTAEEYHAWPESIPYQQVAPAWEPVPPGEVQVRLLGHASVLVRLPQLNLLIDPHWSPRASPFSFMGPKRVRPPAVRFEDLPPIDLVLISHNHYDHLDLPTLKRLQKAFNPLFLVPLEADRLLKSEGILRTQGMDWWQSEDLKNLKVTFVPAQHFSARGLFDRAQTLWGSWHLKTQGLSLYHAGDTAMAEHFALIAQKMGPVDLAVLPIGAYVPWDFMQKVHLNPEQAVEAHLQLQSKQSLAMHYGYFQLTGEPIEEPPIRLKAELARRGLDERDFSTPAYGDLILLENPP
ncbi:MAG: MBL fold metallo-hydrolase [bacterium]|nr:MBL fold metallo-hydrolase [bacterium]